MPEPCRTEIALADAVTLHGVGQASASGQRRGCQPHGVGRLDTVPALAGKPEETFRVGGIAHHRTLVLHEASKSCPAPEDTADLEGGGFLKAVDDECHVEFVGLDILWLDRRLVGRRGEYASGFGLEIELLRAIRGDG